MCMQEPIRARFCHFRKRVIMIEGAVFEQASHHGGHAAGESDKAGAMMREHFQADTVEECGRMPELGAVQLISIGFVNEFHQ